MILLRELFEAKPKTTDFSAISKDSGKLVYFSTKDTMDAAVKAGTHDKPKVKGKDVKTPTKSDLFKGDYEKERGASLDKKNEPSEDLIKAITSTKAGDSTIFLSRKNRNGKIVRDVEFSQSKITPEIVKKTADENGIDLNLINKLGPDTQIKNEYGKNERVSELMVSLVFRTMEANEYAPDGVTPDDYYYKTYSESTDKTAKAIKKGINPDEIQKQVDKKIAKKE